jgi:putative transposase
MGVGVVQAWHGVNGRRRGPGMAWRAMPCWGLPWQTPTDDTVAGCHRMRRRATWGPRIRRELQGTRDGARIARLNCMWRYHRQSHRDPRQDYAGPGMWFVTINTFAGVPAFGDVIDQRMCLNPIGEIAYRFWQEIPNHFPNVMLDAFVVMPNHLHGIVELIARAADWDPGDDAAPRFSHPVPGSLGTIVGAYKSSVTREARRLTARAFTLWQVDYNDERIRTQAVLDRLRRYIADNPARWQKDFPKDCHAGKDIILPPMMPPHRRR